MFHKIMPLLLFSLAFLLLGAIPGSRPVALVEPARLPGASSDKKDDSPPPVLPESMQLSGPFFDDATGTVTLQVGIKSGYDSADNAQNGFMVALDRLAAAPGGMRRKVLSVLPGHYFFSRPVIFRKEHRGIDLVGAPDTTRQLSEKELAPETVRDQIAQMRGRVPLIDGGGVTSFIVIDGVAAREHLATTISGFYFVQQIAGLGGSYYPDFSYRLGEEKFIRNGGYYSIYAFTDGGVVSVLGNSSVTFEYNLVDQAMAYQCGGVIRNEQYGAPGSTTPSVVAYNVVLNPFAWHTGSFVDNNSGSYIQVFNNQIFLDQEIPHEIDMITNFDQAFLIAGKNRLVDTREDKTVPVIGIRMLGEKGGVLLDGNSYEGIAKPHEQEPQSPPLPENRRYYFLVKKAKLLKLFKSVTSLGSTALVKPGEWPPEFAPLVRIDGLEDNDPLRIANLKNHFANLHADEKNPISASQVGTAALE